MLRGFQFGILLLLFSNCKTTFNYISTVEDIEGSGDVDWAYWEEMSPSYNQYTEDRIIHVKVHYIDSQDSLLSMESDYALNYAQTLIGDANVRLRENDKMNLPVGNETQVLDAHIQLRLATENVFIHYDKDPFFIKKGAKRNLYKREILQRYSERYDGFLHLFLIPFDPEEIASGRQKMDKSAIALGNSIKIGGVIDSGEPAWNFGAVLVHELGHVLGLRHSWNTNDSCEDTPRHANCWTNTGVPPCDGLVSNNVMDYNPHQSALTPCQIAKMHSNMSTQGTAQYRLVQPTWCERQLEKSIEITEYRKWTNPIHISRDVIIKKGGVLYISSWVSLAAGTSIRIDKGGLLLLDGARLYNDCGEEWNGIVSQAKGGVVAKNKAVIEGVGSNESQNCF